MLDDNQADSDVHEQTEAAVLPEDVTTHRFRRPKDFSDKVGAEVLTLARIVSRLPGQTRNLARAIIEVQNLTESSLGVEGMKRFERILADTAPSEAESLAQAFRQLNLSASEVASVVRAVEMDDALIVDLIKELEPSSLDEFVILLRSINNLTAEYTADIVDYLETPYGGVPQIGFLVRYDNSSGSIDSMENLDWNEEDLAFFADLVKALQPNSTETLVELAPLLYGLESSDLVDVLQQVNASSDGILEVVLRMPDHFAAGDIASLLEDLDADTDQKSYVLAGLLNGGRITYQEIGETPGLLPTSTGELADALRQINLPAKDLAIVLNSIPAMTPEKLGSIVNEFNLSPEDTAEVLRPPSKVRSTADLQKFMAGMKSSSMEQKTSIVRSLVKKKAITMSRARNLLSLFDKSENLSV